MHTSSAGLLRKPCNVRGVEHLLGGGWTKRTLPQAKGAERNGDHEHTATKHHHPPLRVGVRMTRLQRAAIDVMGRSRVQEISERRKRGSSDGRPSTMWGNDRPHSRTSYLEASEPGHRG